MVLSGDVVGQAVVEITADKSKLERGLSDAQRTTRDKMQNIGRQMTTTGATLSAALTAPVTAFGVSMLRTAADFESAMNRVKGITQATGPEFAKLEDQAQELGRTTQFSATQAAEAMGFLGQAGFDANEILTAMPGTLNLAAAGQMELARAADIASNVLSGYGMEVGEINRVNDVLAATSTSANTSVEQMGSAMALVAPIANAAGLEFEETAAMIGMLGDAGIQGTRAGTTLRQTISSLENPTGAAADAIEELGLRTHDANGNLLPMSEIIAQLEQRGLTAGQVLELFGQRAGPGMAAMIEQGSGSLQDLTQNLRDSGGTAQELADVQMEGLKGTLLELQAAWEGLLLAVADAGFLDMATQGAEKLASFLTNLAETNPELLKLIGTLAGIGAAAGPVLLALGAMTLAIGAISGPILIVTAAAVGLAAVLATLTVDAEELPPVLREIVQGAQTLAQSLPSVAAGLGAVVAAMVVRRVAMFAVEIGTLVGRMAALMGEVAIGRRNMPGLAAAFRSPVGAAVGLGIAVAGIDMALRKMTGDGIIGHVSKLFDDNAVAAEGAARGLEEFNDAMARAGDSADPLQVGLREIESTLGDFQREMDNINESAGDTHRGFMASKDAVQEFGGEIAGTIEGMREQGAAASDLVDIVRDLEPEIQDVVKSQIDWKDILNELVGELTDAAKESDSLREVMEIASDESLGFFDHIDVLNAGLQNLGDDSEDAGESVDDLRQSFIDGGMSAEEADALIAGMGESVEESGQAAEEAKGPIGEYLDSIAEGEELARDLASAIDDLTDKFAEQHPKMIENNAELATLQIRKAELESITRDLTEAEQAELDAIDGRIESLQGQNEVLNATADAYEPLIARTRDLTGATEEQAFAFVEAVTSMAENGEQGVGIITDINDALANMDPEQAIAALGDIKTSLEETLGPEATAEIFAALGPMLAEAFADAEPEVIEAARALGIPIPRTIGEAIEMNMADIGLGGHMQMMAARAEPDTRAAGTTTGDQFGAAVESGAIDTIDSIGLGGHYDMLGRRHDADAAASGRTTGDEYGVGVDEGAGATIDDIGLGGHLDMMGRRHDADAAASGDTTGGQYGTGVDTGAGSTIDDIGLGGHLDMMGRRADPSATSSGSTTGSAFAGGVGSGTATIESIGLGGHLDMMAARNAGSASGAGNTIGGNVAAGIAASIRAYNFASAAHAAVSNILGNFGYELDSRSPSRVTAREVGEPIVQGIAMGMEQALPELARSTQIAVHTIRDTANAEAPNALDGFTEAMDIGAFEADLVSRFGDLGASVAMALTEAIADGSVSAGASLQGEVEKLIEAARDVGVPNASELGSALMDALAAALASGSRASLEVVLGLIDDITTAIDDAIPGIAQRFTDAWEEIQRDNQFVEQFGDLGGKIASVFWEALEDPEGRHGASLARAVDQMIQAAEEAGVPKAAEMGDKLIKALATALATGSDDAIKAVWDIIDELDKAVEDAEDSGKSMGDAFLDGWNTSIREERVEEKIGSDGLRFIKALEDGIDSGSPSAIARVGQMARDLITELTEGMDPSEADSITRRFMDAVQKVIEEEGEITIGKLIDMLAEIRAAGEGEGGGSGSGSGGSSGSGSNTPGGGSSGPSEAIEISAESDFYNPNTGREYRIGPGGNLLEYRSGNSWYTVMDPRNGRLDPAELAEERGYTPTPEGGTTIGGDSGSNGLPDYIPEDVYTYYPDFDSLPDDNKLQILRDLSRRGIIDIPGFDSSGGPPEWTTVDEFGIIRGPDGQAYRWTNGQLEPINVDPSWYDAMTGSGEYSGDGDSRVSTGDTGSVGTVDPVSAASGLYRVPRDEMSAILHKDEAVLTAAQAADWRSGMGSGVNLYVQGSILAERDVKRIVRDAMQDGAFRGVR